MLEFIVGYSMCERASARASSLARSMEVAQSSMRTDRLEQLNEKIDNVGVIIKAMWELLEEQGMTADQLMDKIEAIQAKERAEAEDGIPNATRCTSCDSMVAFGLPKCQYCGAVMPTDAQHPLSSL